jgi:hypothetical protein
MEYILAVRIGKYKRNGVSRGFDGHLSVYAVVTYHTYHSQLYSLKDDLAHHALMFELCTHSCVPVDY